MVFNFIEHILQNNVFAIFSEVLWSELCLRVLLSIKIMLFRVCQFKNLFIVDAKIFEALHMTAGEAKLVTLF